MITNGSLEHGSDGSHENEVEDALPFTILPPPLLLLLLLGWVGVRSVHWMFYEQRGRKVLPGWR